MEVCEEERGRSSTVQNIALGGIKTLPAQCPSTQTQPKNQMKYVDYHSKSDGWGGKEGGRRDQSGSPHSVPVLPGIPPGFAMVWSQPAAILGMLKSWQHPVNKWKGLLTAQSPKEVHHQLLGWFTHNQKPQQRASFLPTILLQAA